MTNTMKKRLLIVEDDDELRLAMSVRLCRDYDTILAQDGLSAVARARSDRPDAILLDLGLPCGDGMRVLQSLQETPELTDIPVVVLTGRDGDAVRARALAAGARAFFCKPVEHEVLADAIADVMAQERPRRACVLVVEDDADVREGLAARLRAHDFVVILAEDGNGALIKARKYIPDFVLLDLGLPAGDGLSVLRRIKQIDELATIPVIVLSGRDASEAEGAALAAGAHAFFQKPVDEHELLAAIGLEAIGGAR